MTLHDLEVKIAYLLRVGVLLAGAFICAGWIWAVSTKGAELFAYREYHGLSLVESLRGDWAAGNWANLVTYFGLALLVMLPVARVLLTGILFFVQRDRVLGWVALAVFVVLVASFSLGVEL